MNCRGNQRNIEVLDKTANALFSSSECCKLILLTPTNKKAKKALLRYKI